jgi:UDP-N-acetylmuramoyl-tripeptide--D-alanyl-D-alanine ligase
LINLNGEKTYICLIVLNFRKPNVNQIKSLYEKYTECSGVCIDTRRISAGNIFFALKGPNFDGNKYAAKALSNGAKYAVVDDRSLENHPHMVLVEDGLKALQQLAKYHREFFTGPVLGITGSNGKTTTKELIMRVLATSFRIHATVGNLNNHIGVPLTLLSMDVHHADIAIIEMGANHLGEIASYCEIAQPTHGIITNIGSAHIGEFGGQENLIRAKSELFDFIRNNRGTVFINMEDRVLNNMSKRFENPELFPGNNFVLISSSPYVKYKNKEGVEHNTHIVGKYNFMNASAAMAIGTFFGVNEVKAYDALDSYEPDNNRSQIIKLGSNTIILDAYNANPDSLEAALQNLQSFKESKKMALIGDMKELGDYSKKEHQNIFDLVDKIDTIETFFVGDEFAQALKDQSASLFPYVEDLIDYLKVNPISNSVVLIKGSRSMTMEKLIQVKEIWE